MVEDINKLKNSSDLFQITEHNKDYLFNIEIKNVQFQKVTFIKNEWGLSHNIYKNISTLSELFIFLGRHDLQTKFKKSLLNVV
jgi:1,4-alpha-glucan branching enzyme